tara:strand:- start:146 stop:1504 length:1359 start_codon:yes stop_codon:yes gene_type:complete
MEAEQSVIGGLLVSAHAWPHVGDVVREDDFYREDHRLLFAAISSLANDGSPHDQVTVVESLRSSGSLEKVGASYVGNLAMDTPGAANIRAYAKIVAEHAQARALIRVGDKLAEMGFAKTSRPIVERLDEAESLVGSIREHRDSGSIVGSKEAVRRTIDQIQEAFDSDGTITGLSTGLTDLDRHTGGLQPADLVYLAARPSMGKTSLAMQIASKAAIRGEHVAVFSLEMPVEQLIKRAQSNLSNVELDKLIHPKEMTKDDWTAITNASAELAQGKISYVDAPSMTVIDIRAKARQLHRKEPLKLVVIDYLQMIRGNSRHNNRNGEIEEISRSLKALGRELNCPILCLSQLNRSLESRSDKRPMLSDLRDSGSIEQDGDLIMFLYLEEKYDPDSPHAGINELLIRKFRNGATGSIDLQWNGPTVAFRDYVGPNRKERDNTVAPKSNKGRGLDYE